MSVDPWTEERIALLKKLWIDGATAQAIAAQLGGVSRSAVLGKVFRLRLGELAPAQAGKAAAHSPPQAASAATVMRLPAPPAPLAPSAPARRRGRGKREGCNGALPATRSRRGKSLLELTNECCRWPHGRPGSSNFFFCGASGANLEAGMPYCARHMRRAYVAHPGFIRIAKSQSAPADEARPRPSAAARDYAWRAPVRHPAARWR